MKKIGRIIKNNLFGFIVGALVFGGVGVAYAANVLSSNVSYSNTNSKMGASNVSDALDELYEMAKSGGGCDAEGTFQTYDESQNTMSKYYTNATSLISEMGQHIYLKRPLNSFIPQACLNLNNEEFCLNNNEYETSVSKLNTYFGSNNCEDNSGGVKCTKDGFECTARDDGGVYCAEPENDYFYCQVNSDGSSGCDFD